MTRAGKWTRWIAPLTLTMLAAGCVSVSPAAICDGTAQVRTDHAAALAQTADDAVALTGARLVELIDAGCRG